MTSDAAKTGISAWSELPAQPTVKELCSFLSRYAVSLLGAGATCIRLEKNIRRIADAFGTRAEVTIMPRHIHLTVCSSSGDDMFTEIATVTSREIDFDINTRLSRLSWEIADRRISFNDAVEGMERIITPRRRNNSALLIAVSLANASFCRLFGGDMTAACVVATATLSGFGLKQIMAARHIDTRVIFIICAFVSSVLGATDRLFSLGSTPEIAIGTSVLYLVPGIPFLNAFSDMLYRHYICAFCRFADAAMLTCCLSIGLCGGMFMMNENMF